MLSGQLTEWEVHWDRDRGSGEREPSSARPSLVELGGLAAEAREFLSQPLSTACSLTERAAPHERFGLRPSCVGAPARSLSLSLSLAYPSFVSHFCLSLFLSFGFCISVSLDLFLYLCLSLCFESYSLFLLVPLSLSSSFST